MPKLLDLQRLRPSFLPFSSWHEHGPFAMWLVENLAPRVIVELGSHFGYSYFCMCQAVVANGLDTRCYAVDTWQGDEHAGNYGAEIFANVSAQNKQYEGFSTLLRKRFDEALADVADGYVDLLHVDGRHFYEDVKEDFESWMPKLSPRAVVLFHDTAYYKRGFGVHRYWAELTQHYPSLNFLHCNGLGVLFVGSDMPEQIKELIASVSTEVGMSMIQGFFEASGRLVSSRYQYHLDTGLYLDPTGAVRMERRGALPKDELRDVRRHPLREAWWLLGFHVLTRLTRASLLFSNKTRQRFVKSAAKRDPNR